MATKTLTKPIPPLTRPALPTSTASGSVLVPRLILSFLLVTSIFIPQLYTPILNSIYNTLYSSPVYRFSGMETLITVFFYALIEILYTIEFVMEPSLRIDVRGPSPTPGEAPTRPSGMRRPSRRMGEIGLYILPLLMMDLTMVKKYAGVSIAEIRESANYPPVQARDGSISASFLLPTFHNFSWDSPLQLWRALPAEGINSRRLVLELMTSFLIYDTLFFLIHLAFHRVPFLARFHRPHHRHGEMNPQVTNQLTIVERLSLVLLANFSLNIIRAHVFTRTCFIPIFVYLLVDIHSGLDLEWSYDKVLPVGMGAGTRKHARHHREGNGGYEPFFTWWDNVLERVEGWGKSE